MKFLKLPAIVACAVLSLFTFGSSVARAQTNLSAVPNLITNPPTLLGGLTEIKDALTSSTNWVAEVHGLYAPALGNKYGFGLGYFYQVDTYVLGGVRLDYVDGGFVMPSGNATLQLPLQPFSKFSFLPTWLQDVTTTPFAYAGIGVPVSGATIGNVTIPGSVKDNNGQPTAIIGQGISIEVYSPTNANWNVSVVADRETWSGYNGTQYRFGALFHHRF